MRQFEKTQIICSVNIIFHKMGAELIGSIEKGFDTENNSRYFVCPLSIIFVIPGHAFT